MKHKFFNLAILIALVLTTIFTTPAYADEVDSTPEPVATSENAETPMPEAVESPAPLQPVDPEIASLSDEEQNGKFCKPPKPDCEYGEDEHGKCKPEPTKTATATKTEHPTQTSTRTPRPTHTPSNTPTIVVTPTQPSPSPTNSSTPTNTATITATNTATQTATATNTPVTATPTEVSPTPTGTVTASPTITATSTTVPTQTATAIPTGTIVPTQTPVITPTKDVEEYGEEEVKPAAKVIPVTGRCAKMEPIIYEESGDIYSLDSTLDEAPTNMTLGFQYPVSNPDGKECEYVAEVERDGQKDIALFNAGGFVRYIVETKGDDQSPTWNGRGNINYSDATDQMHEVDVYGNDISKNLGFGTNPVNANNSSHFAYQSTAGNIIIDGEEFVAHGVPLNFDWIEPILYYRSDETGQVMMLNYETSEVTRSESGANDIAPNPSVTFDGLVSIENSDKILKLNLLNPIAVGCQQDWWRASK